jgi:hypothetical protein
VFVVRNDDIFPDGDHNPPQEVEVVIRLSGENKVHCLAETSAILDVPTTTAGTTTSPMGTPDTGPSSHTVSQQHLSFGNLLFYPN